MSSSKPILLWPPFLAVLCCQWQERIAKITEVGDISPSLTLSINCQISFLIAAVVHSQSVNSPSNQLPTSSPYLVLFFCSYVHQYFYFHIIICTSITPVLMLNCNYFASMAYLFPYLPNLLHLHTMYMFYFVIDCTFVYPICNSVVVFVALLCFILARSQ